MNENINNCFTELEDGKVNAKFNKATMKCFDSENNKFSMDCEGNLVVNSIITREQSNTGLSFNDIYPIGSIYMSVSAIDPSTLFGGVWEIWGSGRVPVGVDTTQDEFNTIEKLGGDKNLQAHSHTGSTSADGDHSHSSNTTVSGWEAAGYGLAKTTKVMCGFADRGIVTGSGLNTANAGYHAHTLTTTISGSGSSQNLQPYITCYMWKRVS